MLSYPINHDMYFSVMPPAKQRELLKHLSKREHTISHEPGDTLGDPVRLKIQAGTWVTTLLLYSADNAYRMTDNKALQNGILLALREDKSLPPCPLTAAHMPAGTDWRKLLYCEATRMLACGSMAYIMADTYDMTTAPKHAERDLRDFAARLAHGVARPPIDITQWTKGIVYPDAHIDGGRTGPGSGMGNAYDAALIKRLLNGLAKLDGTTPKKLEYTVRESDDMMRVLTAKGNEGILMAYKDTRAQ